MAACLNFIQIIFSLREGKGAPTQFRRRAVPSKLIAATPQNTSITRFFSALSASPVTSTLLASMRRDRSSTAWSMSNSQLLGMERVSSLSSSLLSRTKRWRRTGSQHSTNWKRGQCGKRHLNHGMGATRIRTLRGTVLANKTQSTLLRRLLPFA
ncbi:hypothetical protein BDF22DRAFT_775166 [Syncephalis plumigaleata]|nr:hypothetical protein BDF22DRAFT_775166 [Syncephalis plumigaleata]